MSTQKQSGFTLIELMIVIAIIAILSVIGIVVYTNIQKNTRDAKRKADVQAISAAYETKYSSSGIYTAPSTTDFSSGVPQDPTKGAYFNALAADGSGFKVCASLENDPNPTCNTPAINCYCQVSSQGTISSTSTFYSAGTSTPIDFGGSSTAASCDPNGLLPAGLVNYWKFDEGSGTSVSDSIGGVNGTWNGPNSHWTGSASSGFGSAANFSGTNENTDNGDYLSFNTWPTINPAGFSISFWINAQGGDQPRIMGIEQYCDQGPFSIDYYPAGGNISFTLNSSTGGTCTGTSVSASVNAGSWHHIAVTFDGTVSKMYVDGNPKATSSPFPGPFTTTMSDSFIMGRVNHAAISARYFGGKLDEVRIYNRALSAQEITNLYNVTASCP